MKLLFFSPFSGIWEFAALEGRVAASLQADGHEVAFITCGGVFDRHCVVMAAHGLPPDATSERRERVCDDCRLRADTLKQALELTGERLVGVLSEESIAATRRMVDGLDPRSALDLIVDDIPVGRRALYPFLALKKKDRLDLSDAEWTEYRDQLCNTILSVKATGALIDKHRPDAVVTYSSTYSIVAACLEVARNRGLKEYFMEASGGMGSRHYRAILARGGIGIWYEDLRRAWELASDLPASPEHLRLVSDHMLHLFGSKSAFVYSASARAGRFDGRDLFHVRPGQRMLLATMSSYDEWFAAEEAGLLVRHRSAFDTQHEWVDMLLEFIARRPDLFLVLRVHPREFPNRRDSIYSDNARRLTERLRAVPENCAINWPDQNLSLYDLAKCADVVLNAWSSAGKELGLLGIPVVEWAPDVLLYPPDPTYVARDASEYEACIERALASGWSGERVRRMFRWCALEFGAATFGSAAPTTGPTPPGSIVRLWRAVHRRVAPMSVARTALRPLLDPVASRQIVQTVTVGAYSLVSTWLESSKEATSSLCVSDECRALAREVERLVLGLYGSLEDMGDGMQKALLSFAREQRGAHASDTAIRVRSTG